MDNFAGFLGYTEMLAEMDFQSAWQELYHSQMANVTDGPEYGCNAPSATRPAVSL